MNMGQEKEERAFEVRRYHKRELAPVSGEG